MYGLTGLVKHVEVERVFVGGQDRESGLVTAKHCAGGFVGCSCKRTGGVDHVVYF